MCVVSSVSPDLSECWSKINRELASLGKLASMPAKEAIPDLTGTTEEKISNIVKILCRDVNVGIATQHSRSTTILQQADGILDDLSLLNESCSKQNNSPSTEITDLIRRCRLFLNIHRKTIKAEISKEIRTLNLDRLTEKEIPEKTKSFFRLLDEVYKIFPRAVDSFNEMARHESDAILIDRVSVFIDRFRDCIIASSNTNETFRKCFDQQRPLSLLAVDEIVKSFQRSKTAGVTQLVSNFHAISESVTPQEALELTIKYPNIYDEDLQMTLRNFNAIKNKAAVQIAFKVSLDFTLINDRITFTFGSTEKEMVALLTSICNWKESICLSYVNESQSKTLQSIKTYRQHRQHLVHMAKMIFPQLDESLIPSNPALSQIEKLYSEVQTLETLPSKRSRKKVKKAALAAEAEKKLGLP